MPASFCSMWAFRVVLGVVLAKTLRWGVLGMWGAMFVDWAVRSALFSLRYRGRRWETKALTE